MRRLASGTGAGLIILMVTSWALAVSATERSADEVSRMATQISQEIYSPYCPGKTLAMCPSGNALDARMEIQDMARQGMSKDQIKATVLERYGEGFELVEPPRRDNLGLLGGIVGGLAIAVIAVGFLARRRLSESDEGRDEFADSPEDHDDNDLYLDELRSEYKD